MTELTDEDRAGIAAAMGESWNGIFLRSDIERVFLAGKATEREVCAQMADEYANLGDNEGCANLAKAIRARGK